MKYHLYAIWQKADKRHQSFIGSGAVAVCFLIWFFVSSSSSVAVNVPTVTIAYVKRQTIPQIIKVPSILKAHAEVLIRNRVDGQIKKIHFNEGQVVEEGALLFSIDDDLLQNQLKQIEASAEKNTALLAQSEKEMKRYQILVKKSIVTQSAVDKLEATLKSNKANLDADKAQIDSLKLQIGYAQIKSPMNGIAGFVKAEPGAFVRQSEDMPLVSIVQIDPIDVIFDIPEKYLSQVLNNSMDNIRITLTDINQKSVSNACKPSAIDQGVNAKSGVFSLKVSVENKNLHLRPGMSVNGSLELDSYKDVLVVPNDAVLIGQEGSYVYTFDQKTKKVKKKNIKIKDTLEKTIVIESGLQESDIVVTEGQIRIKDGITAKAKQ
jgi:multidrug efflux system membrane fusion protein